jgi:hypothetical protein
MEQAEPRPTYYVDTNSLMYCSRHFNDLARFRGIWDPLAGLVRAGRLRAPEQVISEAARMSELLKVWTAANPEMSVDTSELWEAARIITRRFTYLINSDEPGTAGDPWLIALAERHDASMGLFDVACFVVTEEKDRRRPEQITRITEVCNLLGILHTDVWGMFTKEGWRVGLVPNEKA